MIRTRARIAKLEPIKIEIARQIHKGFDGKTRAQIMKITGLTDPQISELKNLHLRQFSIGRLIMLANIFGFEAKIGFTG